MSGVEGLQQVRRLTASNLSHHDMIRSMPQGMAHEIADRDRAFLQAPASNRTQFEWSMRSSSVSSIATMRSSTGSSSMRALSKVVLPDPVPPETRMLRRVINILLCRFQDVFR